MLSRFSKVFILINLLVVLFKVEFFPFSNYQMYSESVNPTKFNFYKVTAVTYGDSEVIFQPGRNGLFYSQVPFFQSIDNNYKKTKDYKIIVDDIYSYSDAKKKFKQLRLYNISFDWENYKKLVLLNHSSALKAKEELLADAPWEKI